MMLPLVQVLYGSLSREKRSQHVDVENPMEVFLGNRFDRLEFVNTRVVNQNIEATVVFDGGVDDGFRVGGLRYVTLYCDSGTAVLFDGGDHIIGTGFARSIVDNNGGAVCG